MADTGKVCFFLLQNFVKAFFIGSPWEGARRSTFSVFLDIFYPPTFGCFEEKGLFQHPRLFSTVIRLHQASPLTAGHNRRTMLQAVVQVAARELAYG